MRVKKNLKENQKAFLDFGEIRYVNFVILLYAPSKHLIKNKKYSRNDTIK